MADGARASPYGLDFAPSYLPNFVGAGVGFAPDYVGSDDYRFGVAPFGRLSRGARYVDVAANFARVNVLNDPNWRLGPAATLRFGRDDVEDRAVRSLPDIDTTIEVGGFLGYEVAWESAPRRRFNASVSLTHDALGAHDGFVASVSLRKWFPVGRFAAFGMAVGTSYGSEDYADAFFSVTPAGAGASGLPAFDADAGLRDVRVTAVFVQPVSETFIIGAGALYGRLIGDAADSPIVKERGSPDQLIFGIGAAFLFR